MGWKVQLTTENVCPKCKGTGANKTATNVCPRCGGEGFVYKAMHKDTFEWKDFGR